MSDSASVRREITDLLQEAAGPDGGDEAHERLYEAAYLELRRMAAGLMRRERHQARP